MKILVSRPKQYADRIRSYNLLVDGKLLARIKAGEEIYVTLPENARVISAKIDWCSSNKFNLSSITANEKIEVKNAIAKKIFIPFYVLYAITFKKNAYLHIAKAI